MIVAGAIVSFGLVFIAVAIVSARYTALVGIGGLLVLIGLARLLLP